MSAKKAYSLAEAAEQAGGISVSKLRQLIANNDIGVKYIGNKPVILETELTAWLDSLPAEAPSK